MDILSKIRTCVNFVTPDDYKISYIVDDPHMDREQFIIQSLESKVYTPTSDDKIYFMPECCVPRFKVKQFCEKHNNAVVKYKEKANVIFTSPSLIDKLVGTTNDLYYKTPILEWFKKTLKNDSVKNQLIADIAASTSHYIMIGNYALHDLKQKHGINLEGFLDKEESENIRVDSLESPDIVFDSAEAFDEYKNILANPNIYHQNELLYRLSENVMTKEEYLRVNDLLKSTDKENTKLVMEIMANCNYRKSAVYLLLLLKEHGLRFWDSETRDHINFTSLLTFFDVRNRLTRLNPDDIVKVLLNHRLLNKTNHDIVMPLVIEHLNEGKTSDYAEISGIKVSYLINKGVEENILDEGPVTEIVDETEEIQPKLK